MSPQTGQDWGRRLGPCRQRRSLLILLLAFFLLVLIVAGSLLISDRSVTNYTDPDSPRFQGNYAAEQPPFDGQIKAVTWNIAFAEEIDQAIAELRTVEELQDAGVIMLQEMDEVGTEQIARALGYNYVYYPASIHSRHDRNFGNAVLSRWPIVDSAKIILPHKNPSNGQIRIATRATLDVGGQAIPVYSVHTETFWLGPKERKDQIAAVADEVETMLDLDTPYAIIGGDFNTITPDSLAALTSRLGDVGLDWVSQDAGQTLGIGDLRLSLDHIFASNMTPLQAGVFRQSEASDHDPVWVLLALDQLTE